MRGSPADLAVRRGDVADAEAIGQLLHDFNSEFDDPTPSPPVLAERVRALLAAGEITVLLGGEKPHGARSKEGADRMDLGTSEDDVAACALYEREL